MESFLNTNIFPSFDYIVNTVIKRPLNNQSGVFFNILRSSLNEMIAFFVL